MLGYHAPCEFGVGGAAGGRARGPGPGGGGPRLHAGDVGVVAEDGVDGDEARGGSGERVRPRGDRKGAFAGIGDLPK